MAAAAAARSAAAIRGGLVVGAGAGDAVAARFESIVGGHPVPTRGERAGRAPRARARRRRSAPDERCSCCCRAARRR